MARQIVGCSLALGLLMTSAALPTSASAWQFTTGGSANALERAHAVALAANGHVVGAGHVVTDTSRLFVAKVNRKHGHEIWRFQLPDASSSIAQAVAVDTAGHVVAAGSSGGALAVIKLDAETGAPHWISRIDGGAAFAVAVDAAGDVIAAGILGLSGMGIVKLAGTTGTELWRAQPSGAGSGGQVRALALDHAGNAVVAGFLRDAASRNSFAVVKLAGTDGSEQWRHLIAPHEFSGGDEARAVAVDGSGDVVAGGGVRVFTGNALPEEFTVVKVAGGDGSLVWRHDVDPGVDDSFRALALDASGDVIAAGSLGRQGAVVKLAGADGSERWRELSARNWFAVAVDGGGNAIPAGSVSGGTAADIVVEKLAGATGVLVWQTTVNGPGNGDDFAAAVATDDAADVVVAGDVHNGASSSDFAIIKLSGATGADF
jgi:outer membrane protein assembly factor BamB